VKGDAVDAIRMEMTRISRVRTAQFLLKTRLGWRNQRPRKPPAYTT
jgi:hypothetical protein